MREEFYSNFSNRIHQAARQGNFPLRVMFELTYNCNFKCRHCYVPPEFQKKYHRIELRTREVFSLLKQLKGSGCLYLGFTGGEIFTRRDIWPILDYARDLGFILILYTNGSLITLKDVRRLSGIKQLKVDITLPAISAQAFAKITGVAGVRDKVFKAIKMLVNDKVSLGLKTCLLKDNESEIGGILKFAKSLNLEHRLDISPSARIDGSSEPFKYRAEKIARAIADFQKPIPACREISRRPRKRFELFECGAGLSQAAITPAGELKLCLEINYPNYSLVKTSLKSAWIKLVNLVKGLKPDKNYQCLSCRLKSYCSWCPAKAWLTAKNFFSCDPESRFWAGKWLN